MEHKTFSNELARREFLKVAGVGTMGLALPDLAFAGVWAPGRPGELLVYVGTYTSGKSEGIYLYRLNLSSGELNHVATTKGVKDPSYLVMSPSRRYLYAVNEVEEFAGKKSGALSAFAMDQRTGDLRLLNQQPSLGGSPCYVTVDRTGKCVLVANYSGGNVAVLRVLRDGSLGEATDVKQNEGSSINTERQQGPHAHCVELHPTNRFAYVCDLGADKIMIFRFDRRQGKLVPGKTPWVKAKPGAGPRHLTFHPSGKYAYVMNEMHVTVTAYTYSSDGCLKEMQTVPALPREPTVEDSGADIHISPDGRILYCSNRGHDIVTAFKVNQRNGSLSFIAHEPTGGKTPRNFAIDPTGAFLLVANQRSDNIVSFRRDTKTGRLSATGHSAEVPSPVCLKFTTRFS